METRKLYVIAGCNGAGKTTASYTILPEILDCKEFVNADEIARGLSPFQADKVNVQAGRLMLMRIKSLLAAGVNFAFETTMATKSYTSILAAAQRAGYQVTLLFFWLNSPELAERRVQDRVASGGHAIPVDVIYRRYERGLSNFFQLYLPIVDSWMFIDNSGDTYEIIAEGTSGSTTVTNKLLWNRIKKEDDDNK
jgi:predicted ABC-type ATPase